MLEELHGDGDVRIPRVQPADDLQLIEMMIETIVELADEHHAPLGERVHQGVEIERAAVGRAHRGCVPPGAGGFGRARRRCAGDVRGEEGEHCGECDDGRARGGRARRTALLAGMATSVASRGI